MKHQQLISPRGSMRDKCPSSDNHSHWNMDFFAWCEPSLRYSYMSRSHCLFQKSGSPASAWHATFLSEDATFLNDREEVQLPESWSHILILVFLSIPPHLFSDLCLVTEQTAKFCSNQNLCTHPTTNQPAYSVGSGCEKLRSIAKLRLLMVGNLVQGNF